MSEVITNMKVRFGADTKQFKKGMNDGKNAVNSFKNDAGTALESFANQFGVSLTPLSGLLKKATTATKGLSAGMKSAATSTNIFTSALKILKTALIATGIGALLVALGTLISYFTKTQRGADKVKIIMAGFNSVIDVLIDRLSMFGEGLFKIFSGKFKDGWETLKSSVKGVGAEMKNEISIATELEKTLQKLERREIDFIKRKQELRTKISDLILASRDETTALKDRLNYIEEAQRLQGQLSKEEIEIASERARILKEQQALGGNMIEDDRKLAEAEANVNNLRREGNDKMRELVNRYNEMTNKIEANTKALIAQREEFEKSFKALEPKDVDLSISAPEFETDKLQKWAKEQEAISNDIKSTWIDLSGVVSDSVTDMAFNLAENFGLMLAGADDAKSFGDVVLSSLGGMTVKAGKIIMAAGSAFFAIGQAFRAAITNPVTALAAIGLGAALVAAGTAVQSSLSSVANGGSGSTFSNNAANNYSDFTPSNNNTSYGPRAQAQDIKVEVAGEFRLYGRDLVSSIKEVNKRDQYY